MLVVRVISDYIRGNRMHIYRTMKIFILWCITLITTACIKQDYLDEKPVEFSLVAINPIPGSSEIAVNSKIYATFNEVIEVASLNPYTFQIIEENGEIVEGRISFNSVSKTVMFEPYMPLAYNTQLKIIISDRIRNTTGMNLSNTFNVIFKTRTSPQENNFNPPDGAIDVSPRSRIRLQFNDDVYINSVSENTLILKETITGTHVEFDFELDKASLSATMSVSDVYNASQGFKPETQYTYVITSDVLNRSGSQLFGGDESFTFSTSSAIPFTNTIASNREDFVTSVSLVSDGSIIIAGKTWGSLNEDNTKHYDGDGFVAAIDPITGKIRDAIQFGSGSATNWNLKIIDSANDMITIGNDIYVAGGTNGNLQEDDLSPGNFKMFISKYTWDGVSIQPSKDSVDIITVNGNLEARAIAKNIDGDAIYVVGTIVGEIPGQVNKGKQDIFVAKYDTELNQVWMKQIGTKDTDIAKGITVDGNSIYVAGDTFGDFSQTNETSGVLNLFLLQLNESDGSQGRFVFDTTSETVNPDGAYSRMTSGLASKDGKVYMVGTQRINDKSDVFGLVYDTNDASSSYIKYKNQIVGEDVKATGLYMSPEGDLYVAVTQYNAQQFSAATKIVKMSYESFSQYKSLQDGNFTSVRGMVIDRLGSFFATGFIAGNIDGMVPLGKGDVFITLP